MQTEFRQFNRVNKNQLIATAMQFFQVICKKLILKSNIKLIRVNVTAY